MPSGSETPKPTTAVPADESGSYGFHIKGTVHAGAVTQRYTYLGIVTGCVSIPAVVIRARNSLKPQGPLGFQKSACNPLGLALNRG
jgi:hypothetical protein